MTLVEVSGHVHQAHFWQAKVGQLDVSHWGDQQAEIIQHDTSISETIRTHRGHLKPDEKPKPDWFRWFATLTCLVSGLGERCRNYGGIPKQGQSRQSTFWPCPLAKDPCSSAKWHSLHLPRGHMVYLHWTSTHFSDRNILCEGWSGGKAIHFQCSPVCISVCIRWKLWCT